MIPEIIPENFDDLIMASVSAFILQSAEDGGETIRVFTIVSGHFVHNK